MKLICTQENLKNGLLTAGRIISPNNTLPILGNLLLKTENGLLKISSTNLEIAITTLIRCKIEAEGGITVFAKTFIELINSLPNSNIVLETTGTEMRVDAEGYHTVLKTLPVEDFPLIPQIENKNKLKLPAQEIKQALDQVSFSVSTNQTQPEIAGVLMAINEGVKFVATDRYRLAEKKLLSSKGLGFEISVIIPNKTANELSRIIGNMTDEIEVFISQTQISFVIGQTQVVSRLVDGQYPDYQQIIPSQFNANVLIERKSLINALRAGGIFSHNSNSVNFSLNKETGGLELTAESADVGKSKVEIPAQIEGEAGPLLINFHYVLDALNVMNTEKVNIKIINDDSPALFLPDGDGSYVYLVMPIKN